MQKWVDLARLQDMGSNFCQTFKDVGLPSLVDKASEDMVGAAHSEGQTEVHKSNVPCLDETVQMCTFLCFLTERLLFKYE